MKSPGAITVSLLALTTFQVACWAWGDDRQFLHASIVVWLLLLALLGSYCLALRFETLSGPLKKFHRWLYGQITAPRMSAFACLFLAAYVVWYAQHVWGEPLIRKDYASFLYRQTLLHEIFPRLLAYNPMLNGGYLTYELLMTGSINLFLLTYPISVLFSPETAFKAQPLLLILFLPGAVYVSGRLIGFSRAESLLSTAFALVMTSVGHGGFVQLLRTGTLPYIFSCELALVVFALSYRVFVLRRGGAWGISLIIALGSLAALHPLFLVLMAPPALAIVAAGTASWRQKALYCSLIGIGLLLINGPWASELLSYNLEEDVSERIETRSLSLALWLAKLEHTFFGLQVSLVVVALVGLLALLRAREEPAKRRLGGLLLFAIVYYAFLSATGYYWMNYSLFPIRFVVPLALFLCLALGPAWSSLHGLWMQFEKGGTRSSYTVNAALAALVLFLCLPYSLYFLIFPTGPQKTSELVNWLKDNGDDGRVFIYGPDTKDLAQLSFYQIQSTKPIVGYFHGQVSGYSLPWLQAVGACLQNPETVSECENLYNIRFAITLTGPTTPIYSDGPRQGVPYPQNGGLAGFRLVKTIDNIQIYENRLDSNYFLIGQGQVQQHSDRIVVSGEPADFVVLKFFWFPGLRTEPPLLVEPYRVANGQSFIKVHTRNQQRFEIFYR